MGVTAVRGPLDVPLYPPAKRRCWRWRTVRNPWPGPERVPHPLADRAGEPVRELARGRNGNALLEFEDGTRVVAPWRAAL